MLKAVKRGKFTQVTVDGGPVDIKLFGCTVVASEYVVGGKKYAKFDLSRAVGRQELERVGEFIRKTASPRFCPLRLGLGAVVVKLGRTTRWETPHGPGFEFYLHPGVAVDLVVAPGSFGDFGWCVNVKRIKKSGAGVDESAWAPLDLGPAPRAPPSTPAGSP